MTRSALKHPKGSARRGATEALLVQHATRKSELTIDRLDRHTILIEGPARDLRFLGKLLLARASARQDCGLQIGPRTAGSRHFSPKSKFGLYIHNIGRCK